jgi:hypothetical protein
MISANRRLQVDRFEPSDLRPGEYLHMGKSETGLC